MCSPREPEVLSAALQSVRVELLLHPARDIDDAIEGRARPRVEIENRVVHRVERTDARVPGIDGDAADLHRIQ